MKSLTNYILESTKHARGLRPKPSITNKKYHQEYFDFFDINTSYRKPITVELAVADWNDNIPKKQPKGSVVIGTGKLKGKAIITNDGEDNVYDEIVKLNKTNSDLELYVQLKYKGDEEFCYPIYQVDSEGNTMVSVAPNAKISTVEF
jgi:hypothetical protein